MPLVHGFVDTFTNKSVPLWIPFAELCQNRIPWTHFLNVVFVVALLVFFFAI